MYRLNACKFSHMLKAISSLSFKNKYCKCIILYLIFNGYILEVKLSCSGDRERKILTLFIYYQIKSIGDILAIFNIFLKLFNE